MNKYIMSKGSHLVEIQEIDQQARLTGLKGWLDTFELIHLLTQNGYTFIK
jgi:hypothetical protein